MINILVRCFNKKRCIKFESFSLSIQDRLLTVLFFLWGIALLEKWYQHWNGPGPFVRLSARYPSNKGRVTMSGYSLHAFSGRCLEKPIRMDGRKGRKMVMVGPIGQRTHVQVERGYFGLRTDGRTDRWTDGQPENRMPPAPKVVGTKH